MPRTAVHASTSVWGVDAKRVESPEMTRAAGFAARACSAARPTTSAYRAGSVSRYCACTSTTSATRAAAAVMPQRRNASSRDSAGCGPQTAPGTPTRFGCGVTITW